MTPFGLRKRLKNTVKSLLGMDPPAPPPPPPKPAPVAASPRPKPAPRPTPPPPPAPVGPPPEGVPGGSMWVQGARVDEVLPNTARVIDVFGKKCALFNVDGEFFATLNTCPHAGGALGEGELDGHAITCPFHAFQYDVRTGECLEGDADSVATVRVKVEGNLVLLEV